MKSKKLFLSTLLILTTALCHADLSEVESTVQKARARLGSEDALQAVQTLRFEGSITLHQNEEPMKGRAILSFRKPHSQMIEFIFEDQSMVTGFDGWEAYEYIEFPGQDGARPLRALRSVGGEELRRNQAAAIENLSFFRPFPFVEGKVIDRGTVEVNRVPTHCIDFVHFGEYVFRRYFERETGRLARTELDTGIATVESGEKLVDGIRFSTKIAGFIDGRLHYEMVLDKIEVNPDIPASFFDFPNK